ncbi:hypothetical protein OXX79_013852, partial [Metschnikowia pulcherrima]
MYDKSFSLCNRKDWSSNLSFVISCFVTSPLSMFSSEKKLDRFDESVINESRLDGIWNPLSFMNAKSESSIGF